MKWYTNGDIYCWVNEHGMIVCRPHVCQCAHCIHWREANIQKFERCLGKLPTEDRDGSEKILIFDKTMGVGLNWCKI